MRAIFPRGNGFTDDGIDRLGQCGTGLVNGNVEHPAILATRGRWNGWRFVRAAHTQTNDLIASEPSK